MLKKLICLLLTVGVVTCTFTERASAQENPTNPKAATPEAQALKIYKTFRDQDYKALFYLLAFTPKNKATLTTADQFAIDMQKGYEDGFKTPQEKEAADRIFRSIANIMIGEPVVLEGKAVVPTSAKITVNNQTQTFKGQLHLINDEGIWKLDLTITDDAEKATAQRVGEMLGQPEKAP